MSGRGPDHGRRVKGTIDWVSAGHAIDAEVRLYDRLFAADDPEIADEGDDFASHVNPQSLEVLTGCKVEPGLATAAEGDRVQFERVGYFSLDPDSRPGRPVFNRIVGPAGHVGAHRTSGTGPGGERERPVTGTAGAILMRLNACATPARRAIGTVVTTAILAGEVMAQSPNCSVELARHRNASGLESCRSLRSPAANAGRGIADRGPLRRSESSGHGQSGRQGADVRRMGDR